MTAEDDACNPLDTDLTKAGFWRNSLEYVAGSLRQFCTS
jgi:hypothetical protein